MRTDFLTDEEAKRRMKVAVERNEGERVNAPNHPYHGYIRIDEGIYWDPVGKAPHFNIQDLLQMVDLPVTPENVAELNEHLGAIAKKYGAELVVVPDDPRIKPYGSTR